LGPSLSPKYADTETRFLRRQAGEILPLAE
jgi:hypothetical protein